MRKPSISILLVITVVFSVFTLGFFAGRNRGGNEIVVSVPAEVLVKPSTEPEFCEETTEETAIVSFPISINQADKEDLMALPGIGEVLADRIISYRDANGNFSSSEELLNVEGIGKKRLEEIWDLITVGG